MHAARSAQRYTKRRESQAAFAGGGGGGKMGQIPTAALVKGKPASPNPKPAAAAAATPGNGKTPVAKRTRGAGKEADDGGLGKMMAKASVPRGPKR